MRLILLISTLVAASPARATPCAENFAVTPVGTVRLGVEVRTYQFARDPRRHVRLETTVEPATVSALRSLGLGRASRAARALGWPALAEDRPLRLVRLRFEPSASEDAGHRDAFSLHESVRDKFATELARRARLLAVALADHDDADAVIHYTFGYDVIAWRDLEESASLGETRFATRTWLAETLRPLGARGAIMIAGTLPEESRPWASGPMRYPIEYIRRSGRGPEVLFFRPARR